jgi:glucose-6-phosphate-specific signal transduction histidine kinase
MHERARALAKAGWKHMAIVTAYAMGLWLFRQIIIPHYVLLTGVRVAALALVPYRYWPALIIGEEFALVPMTVTCWNQLGATWALLNLLPATALMAPVVYAARERGPLIEKQAHVHVVMLLVCALAVAAVCTAYNLLMVSSAMLPANAPKLHYDQLAGQWLLGNFLGILTLVPTVLACYEGVTRHGWKWWLSHAVESRVVFESACLIVPMLALLLWIGFTLPHVRSVAQVCLFLPVVWLALRHGWEGAAFGGTMASLAVVVLMPEQFDHGTMQAEVIIAFAISTMLLAGARVGVLSARAEKERADMQFALELARSNFHIGEMQMRSTAQALEQIRETVRGGYSLMLGRLRHLQPAIDDGGYVRVAAAAQEQLFGLADSLYPQSWRERGLPAALREGAVARMLDESGMHYACDLKGPISQLSSSLHLAVYRTVCEGIAEGCTSKDVSAVRVHVRAGRRAGRRGVLVQLNFVRHPVDLAYVKWEDLIPRLVRSSSGLGMKALRNRAASFEGVVRRRERPQGRSISCLMLDP